MKALWRKRYNKGRQVENSFDSPGTHKERDAACEETPPERHAS